ncbi:NTPase KAP, partial [Limosilactobacillus reuteri]
PLLNYIFINTNENAKAFSEVPDTSIDEKVISDSNFFYSYFTLAQNSRSTILNRIEDIVNSFKKNSISNKQWKAELKEVIQIAIDKNYIRKTFNYLTNYLLILDEEERSLFIKEFLTLYPFDNIDNKKIMNDLLTFLLQELFYSHKEENMKTIINGLDKAMSEQIIKEVNSILNISSANNIKVLSRLLEERKDFLKNED